MDQSAAQAQPKKKIIRKVKRSAEESEASSSAPAPVATEPAREEPSSSEAEAPSDGSKRKAKRPRKESPATAAAPTPTEASTSEGQSAGDASSSAPSRELESSADLDPEELPKRFEDIITDMLAEVPKVLKTRADRSFFSQRLKELRKIHKRILKESGRRKKKPVSENRKPSGFHKAQPISDELCDFFGYPRGTQVPRTTVTKRLIDYIKENKLQDPENGRLILPNDALLRLLNNPEGRVGYFNIQRFIVHHFPESVRKRQEAESATSASQSMSMSATA